MYKILRDSYKPNINYITESYTRRINLNDYIVVLLVIPNSTDMGGFAWHIHMVASAVQLGLDNNKKVYVWFDKGYYYDSKVGPNWWEYYFEQPFDFDNDEESVILNAIKANNTNEIKKSPVGNTKDSLNLFTNSTFQNIMRKKNVNYKSLYKSHIIANNDVMRSVNNFISENFTNDMIGVYYRGTDKYPSMGDNEDIGGSGHLSYNTIINHIDEFIKNKPHGIFVASDEQPFIDEMKKHFGNRVVTWDTSRSMISTSGLNLGNTISCNVNDRRDQCKRLEDITKSSIHRGDNNIPPYKKGMDAIMDILLLSNCDVLFRNMGGGNFSSQPSRFNPNIILYSYMNNKFVKSNY